jgi:hypothetical protein
MAAVPGSILDPSPPGRRHFPGRDRVSAKHKPITVSFSATRHRAQCDCLQCRVDHNQISTHAQDTSVLTCDVMPIGEHLPAFHGSVVSFSSGLSGWSRQRSFETSVTTCQSTRRKNSEDLNLPAIQQAVKSQTSERIKQPPHPATNQWSQTMRLLSYSNHFKLLTDIIKHWTCCYCSLLPLHTSQYSSATLVGRKWLHDREIVARFSAGTEIFVSLSVQT